MVWYGILVLLISVSSAICQDGYPDPLFVTGDIDIHDPSMLQTPAGYYLYSTHNGFEVRFSPDRVNYTFLGYAFDQLPSWWSEYMSGNDSWAPDINYIEEIDSYIMYYAVSSFYSQKSAIGVAISDSLDPGTWFDLGLVIGSYNGSDYNCIDPNLVIDTDGSWWISFGSFWGGIYLIRIDPTTGKRYDDVVYHLAYRPSPETGDQYPEDGIDPPDPSHAIEASSLAIRGGYYYLWTSFDICCQGVNSTYSVHLGRSKNITGPYLDMLNVPLLEGGGTYMLATHGRYVGPGGQDLMVDGDDQVLVYHYYDAEDDGNPKLGLNVLGWYDDDWPYVI